MAGCSVRPQDPSLIRSFGDAPLGGTMKEIKGIARVKFFPGKVEEWKRLTEQTLEIVRP